MRKIIFVLTLLLLVSPAWAKVEISCTNSDSSGEVTVSYAMSALDANLPRAFGLDITLDNDAKIVSVSDLNPSFWVHPGSIDVNTNVTPAVVDSNGTAILDTDEYPQAGDLAGLDSNGMTIEMGSLYEKGVDPNTASSGVLFTFIVDAACHVTIAGNTALGKVVLENAKEDNTDYGTGCTVVFGCPTCPGDYNADGIKKLADLYQTRGKLMTAYSISGFYEIAKNDPCEAIRNLYNVCSEITVDDIVKLADYYQLRGQLMTCYANTGFYECNCPCYDLGTCP